MRNHFVRTDDALIHQILDLGMILGGADEAALPEQVQPRIANVAPISMAGLHDAADTSRARCLQHRELVRVGAKCRMCAQHRVLHELERILEYRLRLLLEAFDEEPYGDLRGNFSARMATHAIRHHKQQRIAAECVGDAILIDLARAFARFLKYRETHTERSRFTYACPKTASS